MPSEFPNQLRPQLFLHRTLEFPALKPFPFSFELRHRLLSLLFQMIDQHTRRRRPFTHDSREAHIDVVNATQGLFDGAHALRQLANWRPEDGREEGTEVAQPS